MNTSLRPRCAVVLGLMGVCLGLAHVPPSLHAKPPLIVSVGGLSPEQVDVCFDQPVDRAVAQEAERYALGGGVEVIGARVLSDGRTVSLQTTGLAGELFRLKVKGIQNLAGESGDTEAEGLMSGMTLADIGNPGVKGSWVSCKVQEVDLESGGADIWGVADSFSYLHRVHLGDFDVSVQLAALSSVGTPGTHYTRAGIMVRESTDPASRNLMVGTYAPSAAAHHWVAHARLTTRGSTDIIPGGALVPWSAAFEFPNAWLRLRRVANTFNCYSSTNGSNWVQLGSPFRPNPAYPAQVLLGLGATPVDPLPGVTTVAQFRQLSGLHQPDTKAPQAIGADALDVDTVQVRFSEGIEEASALLPTNYSLDRGASVISAALGAPNSVTLKTSPLIPGTDMLLTINRVRDRAATPNSIANGARASFRVFRSEDRRAADIGGITLPGVVTAQAGGADLVGAGLDIGGRGDQFLFDYQLLIGDFDRQVRLTEWSASDPWAKAGLMARETLGTNSRQASVLASPSLAGLFFSSRGVEGGQASREGFLAASAPDVWLRLQRQGARFTGYGSRDGLGWTKLGETLLSLPPAVYVGFALASHEGSRTAMAQFRESGPTVRLELATATPPYEPLSASSRRTGLVLSEVMYHPRASAGMTNGEFIELYNSQVFPEEIGGYRLTGSISYTFPSGTILPPGGFVIVADDLSVLRAVSGKTPVLGPFSGSLPNDRGTVRLRHRSGAVLLEVSYDTVAPWPKSADGAGHSLVLTSPSRGERDPQAWTASDRIGGSPGRGESRRMSSGSGVRINEWLSHGGEIPDYIELFNASIEAADLSGCSLSDDPLTARFRIPPGTVIPAGGWVVFDENVLGFALKSRGQGLFLVASNESWVMDAVEMPTQQPGVSWGRQPDGTPGIVALAARTPGAKNAPQSESNVLINEIMYHPLSGLDEVEYIELFNRGSQEVRLAGWRLVDGVEFTFPSNAVLSAQSYAVVAKSRSELLKRYPSLDPAQVYGDYAGTLSDRGERIAIAVPLDEASRGGYAVVNEATYGTGGRWPSWADGGGSSLELVDPRADNQLASNWADSDETRKAPWTLLEHTGKLDHGGGLADAVQIQLLGAGECLIDDVQVLRPPNSTNLLSNSTFELNATGWLFQGNHETSSRDTAEGFESAACLHVRASGRGDPGANRVRAGLRGSVSVGANATLRMQARWLRGNPEVLLRFHGNYLEIAGRMTVPEALGTPGAPNSRRVSNAGPAIRDVSHEPVLPAATQAVLVTARATDADGLQSLEVIFRTDPKTNWVTAAMNDDGRDGDALANDGLWTARLPGQAAGTLVAFHVRAADQAAPPAVNLFPSDAPTRECLIRFGETQMGGELATYRLWMTQATFNRWSSRFMLHNGDLDVTFVYGGSRVIYNAGAKWKGSSWSVYDTPSGNLSGYRLTFPEDDRLLGATDVALDWPRDDATAQAQQTAYWVAEQLNIPWNYRRFVHLFVNGKQRGTIYEDAQQPNSDMVQEFYPDQPEGQLYKIEAWIEYTSDVIREEFWEHAFLRQWNTTGGVKKRARYRWSFLKRAVQGSAHEFDDLYRLVDVANISSASPNYPTELTAVADVNEWLRIFAVEHVVGNWDSYSYRNSHNMYAYLPPGGRWSMMMFDIDFSFGVGSTESSSDLFEAQDPAVQKILSHPAFRRAYLQILREIADGPFSAARSDPVIDARYRGLISSGVSVTDPSQIRSYIRSRRSQILALTGSYYPTFLMTGTNQPATNQSLALLSGFAPLSVRRIAVNGSEWPATWTSPTAWRIVVPLNPGTNRLDLVASDAAGLVVSNGQHTVWLVAPAPTNPAAAVRINEWMAANDASGVVRDPADGDAEDWFELHNTGEASVDLGGYFLTDTLTNRFMFQIPSTGRYQIPPAGYLVVWADGEPQQNSAVASDLHVSFKLSQSGEAIGLFDPQGRTIDSVTFGLQQANTSQGRWRDPVGAGIDFLPTPTPGRENVLPSGRIWLADLRLEANGTLHFSFPSEVGRIYQVEYRPDLGSGEWLPLGGPRAGNSSRIEVTEGVTFEARRFYRVRRADE